MGIFSRKEKSPEEKLVKELVGTGFLPNDNVNNILDSADSRIELLLPKREHILLK